jgi:hypothetical protein
MVAVAPVGFIDMHIVGDEKGVMRILDRIEHVMSPAMIGLFLGTEVKEYVQQRARARFAGQGDDATGPWAPLSPVTARFREHAGHPGTSPINVRTGEMEMYVTQSEGAVLIHPAGATLTYPGVEPGSFGLQQKMETAQMGRSDPSTVKRPVLGLNGTDLMFVMARLVSMFANPIEGGAP